MSHTVRTPLPEGKQSNGRPVWEPPALDYSSYIDPEDHAKQGKTFLEQYRGDIAKTTRFMDIQTDFHILTDYKEWAVQELRVARNKKDVELD